MEKSLTEFLADIEIKRSKRRTCAIEIADDLHVVLRLPLRFPEKEIVPLIARHEKWIAEAKKRRKEKSEKYPEVSDEECRELIKLAKEVIPKKAEYYSKLTGLVPTGIKITSAKKRFGSCSGRNSLCFSFHLMRYPDAAVDYVILHEIAHIKHHNHGKEFYSLVERYMPDYKQREKLLRS